MVRRWLAAVTAAATLLALCAIAVPARAQVDFVQTVYASIEHSIRREFEGTLVQLMREGPVRSPAGIVKRTEFLKLVAYNKATLFATCAAETENNQPQRSGRVPSAMNIVLTTCVEIKLSEMDKFTKFVDYAGLFFPDRIARCGEQARLTERERMLPPYGFLQLVQPRLYDFASYNKCLMASE